MRQIDTESLHAYFDRELSPEEAAAVERAVRADPALAEELRRLGDVDAALGTLPGCIPAAEWTQRVASSARTRGGRLLRLLLPLAAAAGLLLALLPGGGAGKGELQPAFDLADHLEYVWEADADTYGSLALNDSEFEALILAELRST